MRCIMTEKAELVWKYAIKPDGNRLKVTLNMNCVMYKYKKTLSTFKSLKYGVVCVKWE